MGCKLHTLLITNSCINPEHDAFKKLNLISRFPLTVGLDQRVTAEKLSRVLLLNIMNGMQAHLKSSENAAAWKNFIHIIQLCEEIMYTSNQQIENSEEDDKNPNMSLLNWQRKYLLYFETGDTVDGIPEVQWAEWEIIDSVFECVEILYKKFGIAAEEDTQLYQVSTQII